MGRGKAPRDAESIKLRQPDRSGPSDETLLQLAKERGLFAQAEKASKRTANGESGGGDEGEEDSDDGEDSGDVPDLADTTTVAGRLLNSALWATSLAMLHFTLDVLVHNQYAMSFDWWEISARTIRAQLLFLVLVYVFHEHNSTAVFMPLSLMSRRWQRALRQFIFFATAVPAGCYLIHISNRYGYMAVMRRAPPLGCLWIWSVIELDLDISVVALALNVGFLVFGDYKAW